MGSWPWTMVGDGEECGCARLPRQAGWPDISAGLSGQSRGSCSCSPIAPHQQHCAVTRRLAGVVVTLLQVTMLIAIGAARDGVLL